MISKKKLLGGGIAALGLVATLFFGRETYKTNVAIGKMRELETSTQISKTERDKIYTEAGKDVNPYSHLAYAASIVTLYAGGGLALYDRFKREYDRFKRELQEIRQMKSNQE